MKNSILLIFSLLISTIYGQEDCAKFKTGKFKNIENGIVAAEIERDDTIQIEKYGEIEVRLKIVWIDDCNYRLIFIEGNDAFWNSRPKDSPTPDLIVRIIETNENSYLQESRFDNEEVFNYKSKIFKVE